MSKMKELYTTAQEFLELGKQIEELEERRSVLREELSKDMEPGMVMEYNGESYEWLEYERTSTSWKPLYKEAFRYLDDQGQVIVGELEDKATKTTGPFYKFSKVKP